VAKCAFLVRTAASKRFQLSVSGHFVAAEKLCGVVHEVISSDHHRRAKLLPAFSTPFSAQQSFAKLKN